MYTHITTASGCRELVMVVTYLVDWCLMALPAQTSCIMPYDYEVYHVGTGEKKNT